MIIFTFSGNVWINICSLRTGNIHIFGSRTSRCNIYSHYILTINRITTVFQLTHWGRVTHICVSKLAIIGSDNGLSPGRRQAIIWTNAGILLIGPLGTNFSEILTEIYIFSFKNMLLKMSGNLPRPQCVKVRVALQTPVHGQHIRVMSWRLMLSPATRVAVTQKASPWHLMSKNGNTCNLTISLSWCLSVMSNEASIHYLNQW